MLSFKKEVININARINEIEQIILELQNEKEELRTKEKTLEIKAHAELDNLFIVEKIVEEKITAEEKVETPIVEKIVEEKITAEEKVETIKIPPIMGDKEMINKVLTRRKSNFIKVSKPI